MSTTTPEPAATAALHLRRGEWVARPRGGRASVTLHRWERLPLLREALIAAARDGRTLTYAGASAASDGIALAQGMGAVLDLVGVDCERRGEPNLASLVVDSTTHEVGAGFSQDAAVERSACFERWGGSRQH